LYPEGRPLNCAVTPCPVSAFLLPSVSVLAPGRLTVTGVPLTLRPAETSAPAAAKWPLASGVVLAGVLALRVLVSVMVPEVPSLTS